MDPDSNILMYMSALNRQASNQQIEIHKTQKLQLDANLNAADCGVMYQHVEKWQFRCRTGSRRYSAPAHTIIKILCQYRA
jgi:hypothetical protein